MPANPLHGFNIWWGGADLNRLRVLFPLTDLYGSLGSPSLCDPAVNQMANRNARPFASLTPQLLLVPIGTFAIRTLHRRIIFTGPPIMPTPQTYPHSASPMFITIDHNHSACQDFILFFSMAHRRTSKPSRPASSDKSRRSPAAAGTPAKSRICRVINGARENTRARKRGDGRKGKSTRPEKRSPTSALHSPLLAHY
jgi:hypothetical protein